MLRFEVAPKGGAEMRAEMKTQKRVANYKIEQLFRDRTPFTNYNGSIVAEMVEGVYRVFHWDTHLFTLDTNSGEVNFAYLDYYSQTTSALQGKILRGLMTPKQIAELYATCLANGDKRNARRVASMSGMRRKSY